MSARNEMTVDEYRAAHAPRKPRGTEEREWTDTLIKTAVLCGWQVAHFADSRREVVNKKTGERRLIGDTQAKGWPDLFLVHRARRRALAVEIKSHTGHLESEQREWLGALASVGIDVDIWYYPKDAERAKRILQGDERE